MPVQDYGRIFRASLKLAYSDLGTSPVLFVAQDGVSQVREVDADLVSATGLGENSDVREASESLDDLVKSASWFAGGVVGANGHFLALVRMNADR